MSRRPVSFLILSLLTMLVLTVPATAQEKHPLTFEDALAMARVSDPQPSPGGTMAAYAVQSVDLESNGSTSSIWLVDLKKESNPRQITQPPKGKRDHSPRWLPDGKTMVFLSNRSGSTQIWAFHSDAGSSRQITDLPVSIGGLLVSPGGKHFAFTASVYPDCEGDVLECTAKRQEKKSKSKVQARLYDKLFYRHWVPSPRPSISTRSAAPSINALTGLLSSSRPTSWSKLN